jgi:hypothetical protein
MPSLPYRQGTIGCWSQHTNTQTMLVVLRPSPSQRHLTKITMGDIYISINKVLLERCNALNWGYKLLSPIFTKFSRSSLFLFLFRSFLLFSKQYRDWCPYRVSPKPMLILLLHHAGSYLFCLMLCLGVRSSSFGF